eukprot:jgi/Mesvir1/23603/Mv18287-RA.2
MKLIRNIQRAAGGKKPHKFEFTFSFYSSAIPEADFPSVVLTVLRGDKSFSTPQIQVRNGSAKFPDPLVASFTLYGTGSSDASLKYEPKLVKIVVLQGTVKPTGSRRPVVPPGKPLGECSLNLVDAATAGELKNSLPLQSKMPNSVATIHFTCKAVRIGAGGVREEPLRSRVQAVSPRALPDAGASEAMQALTKKLREAEDREAKLRVQLEEALAAAEDGKGAEEELRQAAAAVAALREEKVEMEAELGRLKGRLEVAEHARGSGGDTEAALHKQQESHAKELDALRKELKLASAAKQAAEAALAEAAEGKSKGGDEGGASTRVAELEATVADMTEQVAALEEELKEAVTENDELREELAEAQRKASEMEAEVEEAKGAKEEGADDSSVVKDLWARIAELEKEHEAAMDAAKGTEAELRGRVAELQADKEQLEASAKSKGREAGEQEGLSVKVAELEAALADMTEQVAALEEELKEAVSENEGIREELAEAQAKVGELETSAEAAQVELAQLKQQQGQKSKAVDVPREDAMLIEDLRSRIEELEEELDKERDKAKAQEKDKSGAKGKGDELVTLRARVGQLETEKEDLERAAREVERIHAERVEELEAEKENLAGRLKDAAEGGGQAGKARLFAVTAERDALKDKIATLEGELKAARSGRTNKGEPQAEVYDFAGRTMRVDKGEKEGRGSVEHGQDGVRTAALVGGAAMGGAALGAGVKEQELQRRVDELTAAHEALKKQLEQAGATNAKEKDKEKEREKRELELSARVGVLEAEVASLLHERESMEDEMEELTMKLEVLQQQRAPAGDTASELGADVVEDKEDARDSRILIYGNTLFEEEAAAAAAAALAKKSRSKGAGSEATEEEGEEEPVTPGAARLLRTQVASLQETAARLRVEKDGLLAELDGLRAAYSTLAHEEGPRAGIGSGRVGRKDGEGGKPMLQLGGRGPADRLREEAGDSPGTPTFHDILRKGTNGTGALEEQDTWLASPFEGGKDRDVAGHGAGDSSDEDSPLSGGGVGGRARLIGRGAEDEEGHDENWLSGDVAGDEIIGGTGYNDRVGSRNKGGAALGDVSLEFRDPVGASPWSDAQGLSGITGKKGVPPDGGSAARVLPEKLRADHSAALSEVARLQGLVAELERRLVVAALKGQLVEAGRASEELRGQLASLTAQMAERDEQQQRAAATAAEELLAARQKYAAAEAERAATAARVAALTAEITTLKSELDKAKKVAAVVGRGRADEATWEEMDQLREEVAELEEALEAERRQRKEDAAMAEEVVASHQRYAAAEAERASLEAKCGVMGAELVALRAALEEARAVAAAAAAQDRGGASRGVAGASEEQQEELSRLREEVAHLEEALEEKEEREGDARREMEELQRELSKLEQALDEERRANAAMAATGAVAGAVAGAAAEAATAEGGPTEEDFVALRAQVASLQAQLDKQGATRARAGDEEDEDPDEALLLKERYTAAQEEVTALDVKCAALAAEVSALRGELEEVRMQAASKGEARIVGEGGGDEGELDQLREEVAELEAALEEKEEALEEKEAALEEERKGREEDAEAAQELAAEAERLREDCRKLREEVARLTAGGAVAAAGDARANGGVDTSGVLAMMAPLEEEMRQLSARCEGLIDDNRRLERKNAHLALAAGGGKQEEALRAQLAVLASREAEVRELMTESEAAAIKANRLTQLNHALKAENRALVQQGMEREAALRQQGGSDEDDSDAEEDLM